MDGKKENRNDQAEFWIMPRCKALENHMCISLNGSWSPCCRYSKREFFDIEKVTFDEYRESNFYKQIQKNMLEGWDEGCIRCKQQEERSGKSYRKFFNSFETDNIEFIEISLSNKCNLTCRMCAPTWSTSWGDLLNKHNKLKKYVDLDKSKKSNFKKLFENIDLKDLKRIKYLGGEPFITPEIKDLFSYLDEKNLTSKIFFQCNTNATFFPKKLVSYLQKFKYLDISFSIDGYKDVNDYIRHGKRWDIIDKTVDEWVEYREKFGNIKLSIYTTVQCYNLHDLINIKKYAEQKGIEFATGLLHVPEYLSINALPKDYCDQIIDDVNKEFIFNYKHDKSLLTPLITFTKDFDNAVDTDIKKTIPKLAEYMENHNEYT